MAAICHRIYIALKHIYFEKFPKISGEDDTNSTDTFMSCFIAFLLTKLPASESTNKQAFWYIDVKISNAVSSKLSAWRIEQGNHQATKYAGLESRDLIWLLNTCEFRGICSECTVWLDRHCSLKNKKTGSMQGNNTEHAQLRTGRLDFLSAPTVGLMAAAQRRTHASQKDLYIQIAYRLGDWTWSSDT